MALLHTLCVVKYKGLSSNTVPLALDFCLYNSDKTYNSTLSKLNSSVLIFLNAYIFKKNDVWLQYL